MTMTIRQVISAVGAAIRREFKGFTTDELLEMSKKLEEASRRINLFLAKYSLAEKKEDSSIGDIHAYIKPFDSTVLKPEFNPPFLVLEGRIKTSELESFRRALLEINRSITKISEKENFRLQPVYNSDFLDVVPTSYWG